MPQLETFLLTISLLIILSVVIAKVTNNIGVPVLLLFLGVGMLAGEEGLGGITFTDAQAAQSIGIMALIMILFSGGLDTKWPVVKPVLFPALSLATLGVFATTFFVGLFLWLVLDLPFLVSMLVGAVISSTDAAAVFSILSSRNINLKGNSGPLLELESGSNDPMAIFLTISFLQLITTETSSVLSLIPLFFLQMGLGLFAGAVSGKVLVILINKLKFPVEGFYSVFTLAFAVFTYALTTTFQGSGFLAVYVAGVIVSNNEIVFKRSLFRFFDGLAWLSQIVMFLTLGLLVYPSQVVQVTGLGIMISLFLIFVARPAGVFLSLAFFNFKLKEKLLISWVGLRGAVPIILATFPLLAGIPEAGWIFNVVFFIVLTSSLLQGWTLPAAAKLFKLDMPSEQKLQSPLEFSYPEKLDMKLVNLRVPDNSAVEGKALVEISELKGNLVVVIYRDGNYFVPGGGTVLESGDVIQVLAQKEKLKSLRECFN
ncbi:potassium/proton antiporter [Cytophagaceae bacterium ABcell3]|nr:potassium/proton antiporter [Cytophagaceae bacterium ABcell3]